MTFPLAKCFECSSRLATKGNLCPDCDARAAREGIARGLDIVDKMVVTNRRIVPEVVLVEEAS